MARIGLIILYITLIFASPTAPLFADEQPVALAPTPAANNTVESDADRQLRIYKTALLQGPAEQNRIDAAIELLRRADKDAIEVLMQAVLTKDNAEARRAVCRLMAPGINRCKSMIETLPMLYDVKACEALSNLSVGA